MYKGFSVVTGTSKHWLNLSWVSRVEGLLSEPPAKKETHSSLQFDPSCLEVRGLGGTLASGPL